MGRSLRANWDAFWTAALRDHCHAGLIWNQQTRSEFREALQVKQYSAVPPLVSGLADQHTVASVSADSVHQFSDYERLESRIPMQRA